MNDDNPQQMPPQDPAADNNMPNDDGQVVQPTPPAGDDDGMPTMPPAPVTDDMPVTDVPAEGGEVAPEVPAEGGEETPPEAPAAV